MNLNSKGKNVSVVLLIIDGWGIAPSGEGNALSTANLPFFKELVSKYPSTAIKTAFKQEPLGNKINIADNYSALGTGKLEPDLGSQSLFDFLNMAGISWLVITEPEKFAYCTYFFSNRKKISKNNYLLIPSETSNEYSLEPEMASPKITEALLKKIKSRKHNFILANFASLDLVAHSGNFPATIKAAEKIDLLLKKIVKAVLENSGIVLITSSHGNAEEAIEMKTETNNKKDTANPVPFLIVGQPFEGKTFGFKEAAGSDLALVEPGGSLLDIMPTILKIMELPIPDNLSGQALI